MWRLWAQLAQQSLVRGRHIQGSSPQACLRGPQLPSGGTWYSVTFSQSTLWIFSSSPPSLYPGQWAVEASLEGHDSSSKALLGIFCVGQATSVASLS